MDPIAPRPRAHRDDRVADPLGLRADQFLLSKEPDAHRVHEGIPFVGGIEHHVAGHGGDADTVPVITDPLHDAGHEIPHARRLEGAEAKGVEHRDRTRAHGEDIAQDPPHAGGGALVGLDRRRMVMRLDLERDGEAVADGDDPGVLPGALQDPGGLGREGLQDGARVLVGAVLAPERADDPQLGEGGGALEHPLQTAILIHREAMFGDEGRCDRRITGAGTGTGRSRGRGALGGHEGEGREDQALVRASKERKRTRPSVEPRRGSSARSGCGMRPTTVPEALQTPAIFRSEPFGFAAAVGWPVAST